jgi:succinyl-diaminopimelate desuccinylase
MMMVMRDLARTEHDVGLMLVGDEETGGMNGTKHLLDLGYRCESVVIPDGGYAIDRIATKAKGIAWVTVYAEGESGHASRPWSGASAIDRLRTALDMIMSSFTPLTDHPQNHWESTCSIGRIEGGVSTNQIAARAEAEIDIRYTEEFDVTNWLSQMRAELPQGVTLEYQFGAPMLHTNESHPHVVGYKDAIESVLGQKAEFTVDHGASDARFFSELGIPAMLSQPTGGDMHGPQEWVSIASLGMYYDVLRTFLDQHAG